MRSQTAEVASPDPALVVGGRRCGACYPGHRGGEWAPRWVRASFGPEMGVELARSPMDAQIRHRCSSEKDLSRYGGRSVRRVASIRIVCECTSLRSPCPPPRKLPIPSAYLHAGTIHASPARRVPPPGRAPLSWGYDGAVILNKAGRY